jgi:hypothetical protein
VQGSIKKVFQKAGLYGSSCNRVARWIESIKLLGSIENDRESKLELGNYLLDAVIAESICEPDYKASLEKE